MTQKQFDSEIRRLMQRAWLLHEAQDGKIKLRRVDVKRCAVSAHLRDAHTRLIAPADWKQRRASYP